MPKPPTRSVLPVFFFIVLFQNSLSQPLSANAGFNGAWAIELNSTDIGLVRSVMNFEIKDSTFIAYTRKNADRDILGPWKSFLGRTFTKSFEHGSLINITNGKTKWRGDTLFLAGIFRSAIGSYYFKGTIHKSTLNAKLSNGKKEWRGDIRGNRKVPAPPISNYRDLVTEALEVTGEKIFIASGIPTGKWKTFEKKIKTVSAKVQDDIEMEFAFFYYAGKLPFSHYSLSRLPLDEARKTGSVPEEKQVELEEKQPGTAYLKIRSFSGSAAEMDSVFSVIVNRQYRNLIVDLRGNPGGAIPSGMSFGRHVADTTFYGGVFLTRKWFEKNNTPPPVRDYDKLPHFTDTNFDLLVNGIHKEMGLCLKVVPGKPRYEGRLFILTNNRTASTCEPIVYSLKQRKRAIIIGEKTAGGMLTGEHFKLKDGFSLMVPTADYYAADGYRIDQKGVEPDIHVKEAEALNYVMENLIKK